MGGVVSERLGILRSDLQEALCSVEAIRREVEKSDEGLREALRLVAPHSLGVWDLRSYQNLRKLAGLDP